MLENLSAKGVKVMSDVVNRADKYKAQLLMKSAELADIKKKYDTLTKNYFKAIEENANLKEKVVQLNATIESERDESNMIFLALLKEIGKAEAYKELIKEMLK